MTTKLRVTLHKKGSLPKTVETLDFPLLETADAFVVHGFAYANYLDDLEDPSTIFAEGSTLDLAFEDCFLRTRNWLMDTFDMTEEEAIAVMTTSVDFSVTQVVDGNWGVHSSLPKWVFDDTGVPFDYSCTTSKGPGRRHRHLGESERRSLLKRHGVEVSVEEYAAAFHEKVTAKCKSCSIESPVKTGLAKKLLDAKLKFAKNRLNNRIRLRN